MAISNRLKGPPAYAAGIAWLLPAAAAGVVAAAVISYSRSEQGPVAGGSPYYGKAVQEALAGLKSPGAKAVPEARPALPAGLSPDEYYWCEQCKTYHKRQPVQGQPAGAPAAPAAPVAPVAPVAAAPAAPAAAQGLDGIPPLPAGLSADDYYWCTNCKAYHKRQPAQGQPADAAHPPAAVPSVPQEAAPAAEVIPPLPEGLSPNDYYWCINCKAYHPREAAQPAPANPDAWRGVPFKLPEADHAKP